MNKSVFLDTTVPSYYYKERIEFTAFIDITKRWWDTQKENYEVFISDYTLAELSRSEESCPSWAGNKGIKHDKRDGKP